MVFPYGPVGSTPAYFFVKAGHGDHGHESNSGGSFRYIHGGGESGARTGTLGNFRRAGGGGERRFARCARNRSGAAAEGWPVRCARGLYDGDRQASRRRGDGTDKAPDGSLRREAFPLANFRGWCADHARWRGKVSANEHWWTWYDGRRSGRSRSARNEDQSTRKRYGAHQTELTS